MNSTIGSASSGACQGEVTVTQWHAAVVWLGAAMPGASRAEYYEGMAKAATSDAARAQ